MVDTKLARLLQTLREIAILIISAVEDYLDVEHDKSALAKRRERVRR